MNDDSRVGYWVIAILVLVMILPGILKGCRYDKTVRHVVIVDRFTETDSECEQTPVVGVNGEIVPVETDEKIRVTYFVMVHWKEGNQGRKQEFEISRSLYAKCHKGDKCRINHGDVVLIR